MNKDIDLSIIALDGINSLKTGVGTVVLNFIRDVPTLASLLHQKDITIHRVRLFTSFLKETSEDFNKDIYQEVQNICGQYTGTVDFIHSYADGTRKSEIWMGSKESGTHAQWKLLSHNAARLVEQSTDEQVQHIVFAHDTIFAQTSRFISAKNDATIIWVPHCLGLVFHDRWQNIKVPFEQEGINAIVKRNDAIGSTTEEFKEKILSTNHEYPPKIYSLSNFFQDQIQKNAVKALQTKARLAHVHPTQPTIFAWGRCSQQKAWEIFLPAVRTFLTSTIGEKFQCVCICAMGTASPQYQQEIMDIFTTLPQHRLHLLTSFDDTEPFRILGMPNLKIVAFPSRFEGMSLVSLEAMTLCNEDCAFFYSNIYWFDEFFKHRDNAKRVEENTIETWTQALLGYTPMTSMKKLTTTHTHNTTSFLASLEDGITSYAKAIVDVVGKKPYEKHAHS